MVRKRYRETERDRERQRETERDREREITFSDSNEEGGVGGWADDESAIARCF
jgi:hypothetical protein